VTDLSLTCTNTVSQRPRIKHGDRRLDRALAGRLSHTAYGFSCMPCHASLKLASVHVEGEAARQSLIR
jgi:hypothetical protein